MTKRRLPLFPTLLVVLAVATMIWLGVWQLHRKAWKEGLLARYHQAQTMNADAAWPGPDEKAAELVLFRHTAFDCVRVLGIDAMAGHNEQGDTGWSHVARCTTAEGQPAKVALGWSKDPTSPQWRGGPVTGIIAPGPKLIAAPPQAGLAQLAPPDPNDIPNNHFAYAVQWFLFAGVALVIYVLALRKRWRG